MITTFCLIINIFSEKIDTKTKVNKKADQNYFHHSVSVLCYLRGIVQLKLVISNFANIAIYLLSKRSE